MIPVSIYAFLLKSMEMDQMELSRLWFRLEQFGRLPG